MISRISSGKIFIAAISFTLLAFTTKVYLIWRSRHPKSPKVNPNLPPLLPKLQKFKKTEEQAVLESLRDSLLEKTNDPLKLTQAVVDLTDDRLERLNEGLKISTKGLECISKLEQGKALYDPRKALLDAIQAEMKARKIKP